MGARRNLRPVFYPDGCKGGFKIASTVTLALQLGVVFHTQYMSESKVHYSQSSVRGVNSLFCC